MSAYADTCTGTRHGSHRLPNGSNVGLPLPPQGQTGQLVRSDQVPGVLPVPTHTGTNDSQPPASLADTTPPTLLQRDSSPEAAAAAAESTTSTRATTSTPPTGIVQTKDAQPIEIESSGDESASEIDDEPADELDEDCVIPTRQEIARILGLPCEPEPTGLAKQIGEMTVDQAFDQHALPAEHTEALRKALSGKLSSVPWPRRLPKDVLNPSQRRVDGQLVRIEEAIRLMMASIMAGQQEVALAVGLDTLVRTEKLRADRVWWAARADRPDLTPEALQMFEPAERAQIYKRIKEREKPPRARFFRGQSRAEQGPQQQRPAPQPLQRGRSKSCPPRGETREKATPNGQGPRRL